jgi:hypothetical protein
LQVGAVLYQDLRGETGVPDAIADDEPDHQRYDELSIDLMRI